MLTPKEKAEELFRAMYNSSPGISKDAAKLCAVEAVKELMERDRAWCEMMLDTHGLDINYNASLEVFNEVISEIEKIPITGIRKSYKRKNPVKPNKDGR